jgi:hypothetical protein
MATLGDPQEPLRTIRFSRFGDDPFEGEFYVRGNRFVDYRLTSPVGRIPQDAHSAAEAAKVCMESGAPDAYRRAVDALQAVSTGIVASWPF